MTMYVRAQDLVAFQHERLPKPRPAKQERRQQRALLFRRLSDRQRRRSSVRPKTA